jgi:hypothetical protein
MPGLAPAVSNAQTPDPARRCGRPLIAEGLRNAEIGDRLFISAKTVDDHVSAILGKLDVRTRVEAARLAASTSERTEP